ncbi:MAG: site-specific integrase [Gemmatimonadetes bacterium]|nr:site-specific integrase [Gemmatimonadota bacterium]
MARRKRWSYAVGERPHTVTVFERGPGGVLQIAAWDSTLRDGKGGQRCLSLGYRDRDRAKAYAHEQCAKLQKGVDDIALGHVELSRVFALYLKERTPWRTEGVQQADHRCGEMWSKVLGGKTDPHRISLAHWERFVRDRASGAIDPRGNAVSEQKRRKVRARVVDADCKWLRWVFNWASKWRTAQGYYLMRENPVRGFETPTELNPRRPVATEDRYEAVRGVADQVMMETRWGRTLEARSYLSEVLDIVNGTGRRLSAVCSLRFDDLDLRLRDGCPHGSIRWRADTDKSGIERIVPMDPRVRTAIDRILRERPGVGSAPLFPKPTDPGVPMTRHLAAKWLQKAEVLAGLEPHKGSLWHAYRRKWATERKHLPDVDVAEAGGWKTTETLKTAYQQADPETILCVVWGPAVERSAVNSAPTRPACAHPPLGRWIGVGENPALLLEEVHFCARSSVG